MVTQEMYEHMAQWMKFLRRYDLFCSERWIQELAADMTAGTYAARHGLTTGKYKFALSLQKHRKLTKQRHENNR